MKSRDRVLTALNHKEPDHNIRGNAPPENIMAMWETIQGYGQNKFIMNPQIPDVCTSLCLLSRFKTGEDDDDIAKYP